MSTPDDPEQGPVAGSGGHAPSGPSQRVPLLAAGVLAAAAVIGAVVLLLSGGEDDEQSVAPTPTTPSLAAKASPSRTPSGGPLPSATTTVATTAPAPTGVPTVLPSTSPSPGSSPARPAPPPSAPDPQTSDLSGIPRTTGQEVRAQEGGVTIRMPQSWAGASLEDGPEAAGTALFPDDPEQAARAADRLETLPGSTLVFGIDLPAARAGAQFTPNMNVLIDDSVPADFDLEQTTDAEVRGLSESAFTLTSRTRVDFGDRLADQLIYSTREPGFTAVAYVIKQDGVTYILTYSFGDLDAENLSISQGSAATFSVR